MDYYDMFCGLDVYIYGRGSDKITVMCENLLTEMGCKISDSLSCDLAVAPCLNSAIPYGDINKPKFGTLVFHPSLLPLYRGAEAIRWQFKVGEKTGGGTWFWCGAGLDNGDICEQEVCQISGNPKDYYKNVVIPLALRTLERAVSGVIRGEKRAVPQYSAHATYSHSKSHPSYYAGA